MSEGYGSIDGVVLMNIDSVVEITFGSKRVPEPEARPSLQVG